MVVLWNSRPHNGALSGMQCCVMDGPQRKVDMSERGQSLTDDTKHTNSTNNKYYEAPVGLLSSGVHELDNQSIYIAYLGRFPQFGG